MRYLVLLISIAMFGLACDIRSTAIDACAFECKDRGGVDSLVLNGLHRVVCVCEDGKSNFLNTTTGESE